MKILSTLMLCLCGSSLFAQNGFFLQPQFGAGVANTHWTPGGDNPPSQEITHYTIFSFQGTLDVGYRTRKWEFITGLGYFRTGYDGPWAGIPWDDLSIPGQGQVGSTKEYPPLGSTVTYNPHIILPVKVGYQLYLNKKWVFVPYLGAEVAYGLDRVYKAFGKEPGHGFDTRRFGVFGLAQLNFECKVTKRIEFTTGLSFHYDLTPLINNGIEHDYAMLANLGIRYNFKHRLQPKIIKYVRA